MGRERLLKYLAIGAGGLVIVAVAVAAFISLQQPFQQATTSQVTTPCSPSPCANVRGYQLWVSDLTVDSGVVSMKLTFRNSSDATHADPSDFSLIDSNGHESKAIYDASGCTSWPRTDFNHGAQFGPVAECFRPASTSPPLKLRWTPDFGVFCCDLDITLTS